MKKINLVRAFTLVELIVVITILAVLATIAFVSFQGFSVSARDSARINDVKVIEKGLGLHRTKGNPLPLPDEAITVTASGTTIFYQGYAGTGVLATLKQAGNIVDPLLNEPYTYAITENLQKFQLLAFLEKREIGQNLPHLLSKSYAIGHNEMYPRVFGNPVGTLIHSTDNAPLQTLSHTGNTIDIVNTPAEYAAYLQNDEIIQGTGSVLSSIVPAGSCSRILELGNSTGDGIYTIIPGGGPSMDVYCDMSNGGYIKYFNNQSEVVGIYNFDGDFNDYSGNGIDGFIASGTGVTFGDKSAIFTGTNFTNYIRTANDSALSLHTSVSYSFWVKREDLSPYQWPTLVGQTTDIHGCFGYRVNNFGTNGYFEYSTGIGTFAGGTTTTLETGEWIHIVVSYDGNQAHSYKNGEIYNVNTLGSIIPEHSCDFLTIGRRFAGEIDNVRVYNVPLTQQQAYALHKEGR